MPNVDAIDFHIHLRDKITISAAGDRVQQMARYFGREVRTTSIDELADQYRARRMMAVIMNTSDETSSGTSPVPNDHIAEAVKRHPDVFFGFGAIDPWLGKRAIDEIKRCRELGLVGIGELNPGRQRFYANDARFYPLWEEAERERMIVLFHSGFMAAGAGTPGGLGYKLDAGRPIPYLDDIAADFPNLTIVGAHPSWPWADESLAIARHKANFFIDLSGWAPKYFPESVVQHANSILQDKCLFGSDWPAITPERWISEFDALGVKPEVRQKVLFGNAAALLGVSREQPAPSPAR
jgi:predicted TIM-barrel fold metal-dependent hydrolase